ncbi:hypothetical protein [Thermocaproicibacter melissae]|jgi:hypothetical protein|nr:hypothetical protein [Thermocaproicibacter melissae]WBY63874.1 hypothetical protein NOG13_07880 [Thermocaproicibacter melissae]
MDKPEAVARTDYIYLKTREFFQPPRQYPPFGFLLPQAACTLF